MTLEGIQYKRGDLKILDQLQLPHGTVYVDIHSIQDGWSAIKNMKVRGAPAIAIVGCLSMAIELSKKKFDNKWDIDQFIYISMNYLVTSRPTAVNLGKATTSVTQLSKNLLAADEVTEDDMKTQLLEYVESMLKDDIADNMMLSEHGASHIQKLLPLSNLGGYTILTHCNTGSLATAGYGTALGVVRSLKSKGVLDHVYCTETRPYNQGARLTAYELVHDDIPSTLIADSMVALLMKSKQVSAVIVGADRIAKNGDTANKIGTYQIAVVAKQHKVPFYVAAPVTSHCNLTEHGEDIVIEERPPHELKSIAGTKIAPDGINCWNPAFDVTPHEFITGIISEKGVFSPEEFQKLCQLPCVNGH